MATTVDSIEKQADDAALALVQETQYPTDGMFHRKLVAALRSMAGLRTPAKIEKVPTSVRKVMGEAFSAGVNFEFRFAISREGDTAVVAVNTNCYGREVTFAVLLAEALRSSIPVVYKPNSDPRIEVLGGDRRSGMMSVEMSITTGLSADELRTILKEAGFWEGLEFTK